MQEAGSAHAASPPPRLQARRCVRHSTREAAARCVSCAGFFCRECVSEHGGTIYCAHCLALKTAAASARGPQGNWLAPVKSACLLGASVLLLWLCFYGLGNMLVSIPPDFHDGTLWEKLAKGE